MDNTYKDITIVLKNEKVFHYRQMTNECLMDIIDFVVHFAEGFEETKISKIIID